VGVAAVGRRRHLDFLAQGAIEERAHSHLVISNQAAAEAYVAAFLGGDYAFATLAGR
jgi:hypothetical protein